MQDETEAAAQLGRSEDSTLRIARALRHLMDAEHGNPIVRQTLTCFEREVRLHGSNLDHIKNSLL